MVAYIKNPEDWNGLDTLAGCINGLRMPRRNLEGRIYGIRLVGKAKG